MDSDDRFPSKSPVPARDAATRRRDITIKIYEAILPLLGPEEARELMELFNSKIGVKRRTNLQPVVDQKCELCQSPMKIEEPGDEQHFIISCINCGYMDVLKK
jgi:hypothetical protein